MTKLNFYNVHNLSAPHYHVDVLTRYVSYKSNIILINYPIIH